MHVNYYKTNSSYNTLNKKLVYIDGNEITRNKDTINLLQPELVIDYKSVLLKCNYMYIEEFNRYYFVKIEILTGGRLKITGSVDPLFSNNAAIRALGSCVVARNQYSNSAYVSDNQVTLSARPQTVVKKFPFKFKDYSVFILAAGGEK